MSLSDDFLEAVRRVKRDLFGDSDNTNPNQTSAGEADASSVNADVPGSIPESAAASYGDTPDYVPPQTSAQEPMGSDFADVYQQAASGEDDYTADSYVPSQEPAGGYNGSTPPSDYDPSSYQNYQQDPVYPDYQAQPESQDGRKIYDFDSDEVYSDEKTVISRNTIIRGALQTEDSIRMLGSILGDIECKSNIVVAGKIRGNTTAANAYVVDAQIDGNMMCDDSISVTDDAWILGNLRAQQADIDGKIKGNIETRHAVSIGSSSSIIGNISTDELEIKRGAFVNGQIIMYSPSRDVMDRFDRFED